MYSRSVFPKVVNGLKMATFGVVCFLDFFDLGTGSAISDTPNLTQNAKRTLGIFLHKNHLLIPCGLHRRIAIHNPIAILAQSKNPCSIGEQDLPGNIEQGPGVP